MRETHKDPQVLVQLEQGNHLDREAHEFCTGTHGSCSDWSTSHHLAMHCFVLTQELEEWTKIEDHVI